MEEEPGLGGQSTCEVLPVTPDEDGVEGHAQHMSTELGIFTLCSVTTAIPLHLFDTCTLTQLPL